MSSGVDDLTSQRLIRIAGVLGALISLAWLAVAIKLIRDAQTLTSEEDIVTFSIMAALCLAFLLISYLLAWLKDSPTAALVLVFIAFVPMVSISIDLLRQSADRTLEVSTGPLVASTVANALVVMLVLIAWFHERNHVVPYQSKWQSTGRPDKDRQVDDASLADL